MPNTGSSNNSPGGPCQKGFEMGDDLTAVQQIIELVIARIVKVDAHAFGVGHVPVMFPFIKSRRVDLQEREIKPK